MKRLMMVVLGALCFAPCARAENVTYLAYENGEFVERTATCEIVTSGTTAFANGGWYAVKDRVVIDDGHNITVHGSAHLVLCDDASLTVTNVQTSLAAIFVGKNDSLTICGQTRGAGRLVVEGGSYGAGIGCAKIDNSGIITINGGTVTATGGGCAPGIGCGMAGGCGLITINGGTVTAAGSSFGAAGIGGGYRCTSVSVTVNGGCVTAIGGSGSESNYGGGAGIGGGCDGKCDAITVNGGEVMATGGITAAGIGGGAWASGGMITISGGRVTALGDNCAAGIGSGGRGDSSTVMISGGTVAACGYGGSADIGTGYPGGVANVRIDGGNVNVAYIDGAPKNDNAKTVFEVTVKLPAGTDATKPVGIIGLPEYGTKDIYPLDEGKICLYLPTGDYDFTVDGTRYVATVSGAATTARRFATVTVGELSHMTAAWTRGDSGETNVVENGSFEVLEGEVGIKVVFMAEEGYVLANDSVVELKTITGDITFGPESGYLAPIAVPVRVPYLDWDDTNRRMTDAEVDSVVPITDATEKLEGDKWYVVMGNVEINHMLTVDGKANLILLDNTTLTVNGGIRVGVEFFTSHVLNIYGQSAGTGKLVAFGANENSGIGSGGGKCGTVTINGGIVTADGGVDGGAGIGSGRNGAGGTVTINGGIVTATGAGSGVGIGGGTNGGTVTINGGRVTARHGANYDVDIGCGKNGSSDGTIQLFGGLFGMAVQESWLADGYEVVANTDPETKGDYPWAVRQIPADWPEETTACAGRTVAEVFEVSSDAKLAKADAEKVAVWAKDNGIDYVAFVEKPDEYAEAFLLNCAMDKVADEEGAFRIVDIGKNEDDKWEVAVMGVNTDGKPYNGEVRVDAYRDIACAEQAVEGDGTVFFKASLVVKPAASVPKPNPIVKHPID